MLNAEGKAKVKGEIVNQRKSVKKKKRNRQGRMGDALALGGEEGRDKLRKAAARGKYPLTRGCPNGATRRKRFRHPWNQGSERGELKHLSTHRKRK